MDRRELIRLGAATALGLICPRRAHAQERKEGKQKLPVMYTDMSERNFIKWNLDYTMPCIIETIESIPEERFAVRAHPNISPAGWIFGRLVVSERAHIGGWLQGIYDIPEQFRVFSGGSEATEGEKLQAMQDALTLVPYWQEVREKTNAYLESITDEDLKDVPKKSTLPDGDPNRKNPVREAFVMQIHFQNNCWGRLISIKQILGLPPTRTEKWVL